MLTLRAKLEVAKQSSCYMVHMLYTLDYISLMHFYLQGGSNLAAANLAAKRDKKLN